MSKGTPKAKALQLLEWSAEGITPDEYRHVRVALLDAQAKAWRDEQRREQRVLEGLERLLDEIVRAQTKQS